MNVVQILQGLSYNVCSIMLPNLFPFDLYVFIIVLGNSIIIDQAPHSFAMGTAKICLQSLGSCETGHSKYPQERNNFLVRDLKEPLIIRHLFIINVDVSYTLVTCFCIDFSW